ncbi:RRM domain-containing protein [Caenorhabditis elegans]|uniref:RRM domain-containing protein n=1 Tax=Caenorhabditis elegans TaxID=6239 RepID=Q9U2F5_CAEEL|nr:RRM domain-containing protein [Caenorhabditis elegans]CAB60356.1 RRM domain-containing protein [Caenorhabditis elegans]|eukprot:NP_496718.1 TIA-1/TIAL RNA binding protein homolog [Caenorhabditis elegans]
MATSFYTGGGEDGDGFNPRVHARIAEREGFQLASGSEDPRTLFVANLDPAITDEFLATLFNQIGAVMKAKIIFEGLNDPYAFVEFSDHNQATLALQSHNGRELLEKEMHVTWAFEPREPGENRSKPETSRHFHVFVGDLCSEIDSTKLREAFVKFGEVSEAKIIRDNNTNKGKGYGFVSYPRREDAERAIDEMNGAWLGRRTIRTNWATRKPDEDGERGGDRGDRRGGGGGGRDRYHNQSEKTYDEIFNQAAADNTSVYVGNIANLGEDEIRRAFDRFGPINEVRTFKIQGYAFVKFETKESAARAIVQMNNADIGGQIVRCSWGKSGDSGKPSERGSGGGGGSGNYGYGYGNSGGGGGSGGPGNSQFSNFNQRPPPSGNGGSGGGSGGQNNQYWQYYSQYYNNPHLMQQWNNYWQKDGPPPPPAAAASSTGGN